MSKKMDKKKIISFISILCILFILIVICGHQNQQPIDNKALSLREAYELALEEAKKWNEHVALYSITSTDKPVEEESSYGTDGKRCFWSIDFTIPNKNEHYIVTIKNGQVLEKITAKGLNKPEDLIFSKDIKFDSPQLLIKAKRYFDLKQGSTWAKGYHFNLNKFDAIPVIGVVGWDKNGCFSKVYFNAFTGELVTAEHKVPQGGGFFKGEIEIPVSTDKTFGALGVAMPHNNSNDETMIIWGYKKSNAVFSQIIQITEDSGQSWSPLNFKEEVIQIWFSDTYEADRRIYALSENKLFVSIDNGDNWEMIFNSDTSIFDVDTFSNTIVVLTESDLKLSEDYGNNWSNLEVPKYTYFVDIDDNNSIFISTDKAIYKRSNEIWQIVKSPFNDEIIGFEIDKNTLISYTAKAIGVLSTNNNEWDLIDIPDGINKIFLDSEFEEEHQMYVKCLNGNLFKLQKGGDSIGLINEKIHVPLHGEVMALITGATGELYFCTMPRYSWQIMKRRLNNEK